MSGRETTPGCNERHQQPLYEGEGGRERRTSPRSSEREASAQDQRQHQQLDHQRANHSESRGRGGPASYVTDQFRSIAPPAITRDQRLEPVLVRGRLLSHAVTVSTSPHSALPAGWERRAIVSEGEEPNAPSRRYRRPAQSG